MAAVEIPGGVWPAMLTPLNPDKSIAWSQVDTLTDWYIEAGCAGLFAVGQSSEMFKLEDDERLALARRVVDRAAGRVPVVATGTFGGSIARQVDFIAQMAETGVAAVTVIASALAERTDSDTVWCQNIEQLLALTGDIPLALYECPQPYHRTVSPQALRRVAGSGRFHLLKETSRSLEQVKAKIDAAEGTPLKVYNADATTLLDSLQYGARGYCGIAANFYPDLLVWLCDNQDAAPAALQAFILAADATVHLKYPVSAKYYRQQLGMEMHTISRTSDATIEAYDARVLAGLAALAGDVRQRLHK